MKRGLSRPLPAREQGMVLIVVLIMLGLLTVIVAAMVRTGTINFRVAGNQQYRQEARMAAQNAIESYISVPANFDTPPPSSTAGIDLDGDGTDEYTATLPVAKYVGDSPAPLSAINSTPLRIACSNDLNVDPLAPKSTDSNCKYVTWDVAATVKDTATTGVSVELHQGIKVLSKMSVSPTTSGSGP